MIIIMIMIVIVTIAIIILMIRIIMMMIMIIIMIMIMCFVDPGGHEQQGPPLESGPAAVLLLHEARRVQVRRDVPRGTQKGSSRLAAHSTEC